jgi:simple sugar transport system permease protein
MARNSDVSSDVVVIIQGVIILMIAAEALLSKWKQKMIVKAAKAEAVMKGDEANA